VYALALGFLAWIVLMPLDGSRFHWTHWPLAVAIAGSVLLVPAAYLMFGALAENTFASPLVRIQEERQQHVIATGVYSVVRHPMYLGAVLMFVGAPLLTRAATALGVGGLLVIVLAVRIVGEEKLLVRELRGYDEYRNRVRWRLVPFVF
jgi:protein-S-isoprenylcysteine O-methyltransferase Ste14